MVVFVIISITNREALVRICQEQKKINEIKQQATKESEKRAKLAEELRGKPYQPKSKSQDNFPTTNWTSKNL